MLAVARGAAVGGHHPVEGPVPAPEPRQTDPYHHGSSFLSFLSAAAAPVLAPPAAVLSCGPKGSIKGDGTMPVRPTEWASIWAGPVRVLGLKASQLVTVGPKRVAPRVPMLTLGPLKYIPSFCPFS